MKDKISVLIVDDQKLFSESLSSIISSISDEINIIAKAMDGIEAIEKVRELKPDVILMDLNMPRMNGVEATRKILQEFPSTRILMLATFENDEAVYTALSYGALGYLLKDVSAHTLVASIKAVYEGLVSFSPNIAANIARKNIESKHGDIENRHSFNLLDSEIRDFTEREKTILEMMLKGTKNRNIADELHIGEQTVRNYVHTIYTKLNVHDRYELLSLLNRKS
ncbi:response regulator transcription factor [Marispirochaeta sp.]|uniref:response regulator transcription factor n=1 Tax=Marispirochaeta sp. TaxID=2038653 RepID=UPI0029C7461E|nr:response regulator transcription factor [Marispirochaeta sp.]